MSLLWSRWWSLRWRLARFIAPTPITTDPGDGRVYVRIRDESGDLLMWVEADRFRLKMSNDIERGTTGRFVGTVKAA